MAENSAQATPPALVAEATVVNSVFAAWGSGPAPAAAAAVAPEAPVEAVAPVAPEEPPAPVARTPPLRTPTPDVTYSLPHAVVATRARAATVRLRCGRRIAYLEKGMGAAQATRTLLVLHGLGSSRLANMPGVTDELLCSFGVRLVAIDRPGYGQSDPAPALSLHSFCADLEELADLLSLGHKFYLLGYSAGGAYCWAAAHYIPHRILGIAMWAPFSSFYWQGISEQDREAMFAGMTPHSRRSLRLGRYAPLWLIRLFIRNFIVPFSGPLWVQRLQHSLSHADRQYLLRAQGAQALLNDNIESLLMGAHGEGMAKDVELFSRPWPFNVQDICDIGCFDNTQDICDTGCFDHTQDIGDIASIRDSTCESSKATSPSATANPPPSTAPLPSSPSPAPPFLVHIWHGTKDVLVPLSLQRWLQQQLPHVVRLYELPGEGHLSWFCHQPQNHHQVLSTLFS
ncbi:unnamed protein product [Closterium sp. NIES-64]|nr:unnamed protein product [Closterium sp. NIES-64]CAI6010377.1 unnamed protein product [Closterium sp. NIES-65]